MDWIDRTCATCRAEWEGLERDGDWCPWCEALEADQRALERSLLLDPPWLRTDVGNATYDALDETSRQVWDRTRGQIRGSDSIVVWAARLRRAVDTELITRDEATRALRRITR